MRIRMGIVLAVMLTLGLSGCGMFSSENTDNPDAAASDASSNEDLGRQYAQCMRDHGIPMDDPVPGQGPRKHVPDGMSAEDSRAAQEACKQYLPNGGEMPPPDAEQMDRLREYSKCMRDNGLANFPDPAKDGGIRIEEGSGIDPDSPEFKAAEEACKDLLPNDPKEKK